MISISRQLFHFVVDLGERYAKIANDIAMSNIKGCIMNELVDWIAHYQGFWADRAERLRALLEEMDE